MTDNDTLYWTTVILTFVGWIVIVGGLIYAVLVRIVSRRAPQDEDVDDMEGRLLAPIQHRSFDGLKFPTPDDDDEECYGKGAPAVLHTFSGTEESAPCVCEQHGDVPAKVAKLMEWWWPNENQLLQWSIAVVPLDQEFVVNLVVAQCACQSVIIPIRGDIDNPLFLRDVLDQVEDELERLKGQCVCRAVPYAVDTSGMAGDGAYVSRHFRTAS